MNLGDALELSVARLPIGSCELRCLLVSSYARENIDRTTHAWGHPVAEDCNLRCQRVRSRHRCSVSRRRTPAWRQLHCCDSVAVLPATTAILSAPFLHVHLEYPSSNE